MDIGVPQKCLGPVDSEALRARILEQEPVAWQEQLLRQQGTQYSYSGLNTFILG